MVDEFSQAQVPCQGGRQEQAGIGHQAMVVKEDADTVGIVLWQHLFDVHEDGCGIYCAVRLALGVGSPMNRTLGLVGI